MRFSTLQASVIFETVFLATYFIKTRRVNKLVSFIVKGGKIERILKKHIDPLPQKSSFLLIYEKVWPDVRPAFGTGAL